MRHGIAEAMSGQTMMWPRSIACGCWLALACGTGVADQPEPEGAMPFNTSPSPTSVVPALTPGNVGTSPTAMNERTPSGLDTSGLQMSKPVAPGPAPVPPLSAAEQAAVAKFDGLVHATDWKAPVSPLVGETLVQRAYLDWKSRFYKSCDNGTVYVLKNDYTGSEEVVSEGIGYGMLLSVAIGDREVFDGLWKFYREHRNGNGVMNWRQAVCGGQTGGNGASDADLDSALGLVLADSRWGGYAEDARSLIASIGTNETEQCDNGQIVLKPGDSWGGCGGQTVNPSYFSPGHYRRFAQVQTDRADFWNEFASDTYTMLRGMQQANDGLIPDWGFGDGRSESGDRGQFGYEAVRNPWRVALDYAWSGNADAKGFLQRMSQTVDARGGITAMADADNFEDKRNSAFLGSLSLSGSAVDAQKLDTYVREWQAYDDLDDQWYYQATLRVLFLMAAGGFFPASY
jgi:endo-1,4-beta-D-glucanase Y